MGEHIIDLKAFQPDFLIRDLKPLYSDLLFAIWVDNVHMDWPLNDPLNLYGDFILHLRSIQHLVIHRTLPPPPTPVLTSSSSSISAATSSLPTKTPTTSISKVSSPAPASNTLSATPTISRDRSPIAKSHTSQPSTTFVTKHPSLVNSTVSEPPSPRVAARGGRDRAPLASNSQASSGLYRDDEEKSKQVEALVYVIEGLIYGPPSEISTKSKA